MAFNRDKMSLNVAIQTLGFTKLFTEEELKKRFRERALATHPDKGGNASAFKTVKEAYDVCVEGLKDGSIGKLLSPKVTVKTETHTYTTSTVSFDSEFFAFNLRVCTCGAYFCGSQCPICGKKGYNPNDMH